MPTSESFDTTHERLRALLVATSPAEAAGQLLAQGYPPLHVLHALVTETRPAVVSVLDELVRDKSIGPMPQAYEAYVALQTAKADAPAHTLDRDLYAVGAAERAGYGREAMGQALPFVVDVPEPSVDRQAVAKLLLLPDVPSAVYDRQTQPSYMAVTPLGNFWVEDPVRSAPAVGSPASPDASEGKAELLSAQLAALDADRHQVVVRSADGGIQYLAPTRDGGFVTTDKPTYLNNDQVRTALPTMQQLDARANIDLVSESARHHYLVLDGLDAGQARDLDDRFGASLVMRVGDEHMAVVRLPEDPSRAQAVAVLLRARYPDLPDEAPSAPRPPFPNRSGDVDLVVARAEDLLPAVRRDRETASPATNDPPAAVVERFAEHRTNAVREAAEKGVELAPDRLDGMAVRSLVSDGYRFEQVASALQFESPGLAGREPSLDAYAKQLVEGALKEGRAETSPPDVGGR